MKERGEERERTVKPSHKHNPFHSKITTKIEEKKKRKIRTFVSER
jgi:predicted N-formylglutamate amidohydrolase